MGKFEAMSIVYNEGAGSRYVVVHDNGNYTLLQRLKDDGHIDGTFVVAYALYEIVEDSHCVSWGQGFYFNCGEPIDNLRNAMACYLEKTGI